MRASVPQPAACIPKKDKCLGLNGMGVAARKAARKEASKSDHDQGPRAPVATERSRFHFASTATSSGCHRARFARRMANDGAQLVQLDEVVGLATQLIRDHRRLAADRRDDGNL